MKSAMSLPVLSPIDPSSSSAAFNSSPFQPNTAQLHDDIVAEEWLAEVDSVHYVDCFIKNFPSPDARNRERGIISRKKLETLRLQDYPKMNIKDFEEAKKINEHVKTVLKYEFDSPQRRAEVKVLREKLGMTPAGVHFSNILPPLSPSPLEKSESAPMFVTEQKHEEMRATTPTRRKLSYAHTGDIVSSFMHKSHNPEAPLFIVTNVEKGHALEKKVEVRSEMKRMTRRRSFDNEAWQHINTLRSHSNKSSEAAHHLREGFFPNKGGRDVKNKKGTRRWSMENKNPAVPKDPSKMHYGVMAAHYNMMQLQMTLVQNSLLTKIKKALKCDVATFQFYDCGAGAHKAKMILYHNDIWYTLSMDSFAGHVVKAQELIMCEDAQNDPRLDKAVQEIVGVTIENVIAQPVWCQDGTMIGVIELANRRDEFTLEDPDMIILNAMAEELAHDLHIKYRDLLSVSHLLNVNSHVHKEAILHAPNRIDITHTINFTPISPTPHSSADARAVREGHSIDR